MAEFDILPIIFKLARERDGKNCLTWDEYQSYRNMIKCHENMFTYLDTIDVDGVTMYIDCILLRDIGQYRKGQRFYYMSQNQSGYTFYN